MSRLNYFSHFEQVLKIQSSSVRMLSRTRTPKVQDANKTKTRDRHDRLGAAIQPGQRCRRRTAAGRKGKPTSFPPAATPAGGPEAATGDDYTELMEDFILKPSQFILSGDRTRPIDCSSTTIWKFRRATRRCLSTTMRLHESSQHEAGAALSGAADRLRCRRQRETAASRDRSPCDRGHRRELWLHRTMAPRNS